MTTLGIFTVALAISFLAILTVALVKSRKKLLYAAVGLFIATGIAGGVFVYRLFNKVAAFPNPDPRTGDEMYEQSFSKDRLDCVTVINSKDRENIFTSCCTWMEFNTCPEELQRVLAGRKHFTFKAGREMIASMKPATSERPDWWQPESLGDSALVISFEFPIAGIQQKLMVATDSTKAFYIEAMTPVIKRDSASQAY